MAGHYGYKRFLISTIVVFAIASMGCAISPNRDSILIWRVIQGLAGTGLVVWWRASIYVLVPKPQRSPSLMKASTLPYLSSAAGLHRRLQPLRRLHSCSELERTFPIPWRSDMPRWLVLAIHLRRGKS
jgi:hypothetical protein